MKKYAISYDCYCWIQRVYSRSIYDSIFNLGVWFSYSSQYFIPQIFSWRIYEIFAYCCKNNFDIFYLLERFINNNIHCIDKLSKTFSVTILIFGLAELYKINSTLTPIPHKIPNSSPRNKQLIKVTTKGMISISRRERAINKEVPSSWNGRTYSWISKRAQHGHIQSWKSLQQSSLQQARFSGWSKTFLLRTELQAGLQCPYRILQVSSELHSNCWRHFLWRHLWLASTKQMRKLYCTLLERSVLEMHQQFSLELEI